MISSLRRPLLLLASIAVVLLTTPALAQEAPSKQLTASVEDVQALIDKEPSLPHHYLRMAQLYSAMGREGEVVRYCQDARSRGGNALAIELVLGDFYGRQDRPADALSHYIKVLDQSPNQAHALTQVWFLLQTIRFENREVPLDVVQIAERLNQSGYYVAVALPRGDKKAAAEALARASRMLSAGRQQEAIGAYKQASAHDPWNAEAHRGLGISYATIGDNVRAIGAYHLYIALSSPTERELPRVRKLILDYYKKNTRRRR